MSTAPHRYTAALAHKIESAWQDAWEQQGTYCAPNPAGPWADPTGVAGREKFLVLDMFPYPSGIGLHVGHPLGYIATDVFARYHRMAGKNVLHCMGYDAFGLPAEQFAVQTGQHPRKTTEENITTMERQLRMLGLGHDPRRAIRTIDPEYYRWTQWIFLQLYNAWYDDAAATARPIETLVAAYESGERPTPDGRPWAELDESERRAAVDAERLAYLSSAPVNWCPGLGTVLANEEVTTDGRSERGDFPVFRRNLRQWMMRITKYADRLAADLDRVDWPEKVKTMQRNWIGRSEGARVFFDAAGERIEVFTTRADTLFGATFMVLAPEHPAVSTLTAAAWPGGTREAWTGGFATPAEAVSAYQLAASRKSELDRQTEGKDKSGVFTGTFATNPVDGRRIPVFIADYVLMGYGTGAIMAVPAEDERDWDFAHAFDLDVIRTVQPPADWPEAPYTGDGVKINSAGDGIDLNGMSKDEAKRAMNAHLAERGLGEATVTYRLRDWLFSRQRYWGEPFPIVYDAQGVAHALPESMLPLELPEVDDYSPQTFDPDDASSEPAPPLSRAVEWTHVRLDLGDGEQDYVRETNTMPNWAGSCWYYLRYLDPANREEFVDPGVEEYWMGRQGAPVPGAPAGAHDPGGVDLYVGGVEHAVLHLLYARFWHKALHDLGHLSSEEPFRRYFSQGYIQGYVYRDHRGQPVEAREVEETVGPDGAPAWTYRGEPVTREIGKLGKSLKNGVSPDEIVGEYGADTFRVYEMAMGPLELSKPWDTKAVVGSQRFLQRLWRLAVDEETGDAIVTDGDLDDATRRVLHRTIAAVRHDYETLGFNTAVARLIELVNALTKLDRAPREGVEPLVAMVAPLAPHLAEELWRRLGHEDTVVFAAFPQADEAYLVDDTVTCVVQIQGKVKARLEVPADITETELESLVMGHERVRAALGERAVRKVIVRAPALVNIVAG